MNAVPYEKDGFGFQVTKIPFPYFTYEKGRNIYMALEDFCLGLPSQGGKLCVWHRNTEILNRVSVSDVISLT